MRPSCHTIKTGRPLLLIHHMNNILRLSLNKPEGEAEAVFNKEMRLFHHYIKFHRKFDLRAWDAVDLSELGGRVEIKAQFYSPAHKNMKENDIFRAIDRYRTLRKSIANLNITYTEKQDQ